MEQSENLRRWKKSIEGLKDCCPLAKAGMACPDEDQEQRIMLRQMGLITGY